MLVRDGGQGLGFRVQGFGSVVGCCRRVRVYGMSWKGGGGGLNPKPETLNPKRLR